MRELDRFATSYKKNVQAQTKLMVIMIGSVVLTGLLVLLISLKVFHYKLLESVDIELDHTASAVYDVVTNSWRASMASSAFVLSLNPDLTYAVAEEDYAELDTILKEVKVGIDADFIAVVDKEGSIVGAQGCDKGALGDSEAIEAALKGENYWATEGFTSCEYALMSAGPLKDNGRVVGAAVVAYDLTNDYLVNLVKKQYDMECTVFKGKTRLNTTIKDSSGASMVGTDLDNPDIIHTVLEEGKPYKGQNKISGTDYACAYFPLKSQDGCITGILFIAKPLSYAKDISNKVLLVCLPLALILVLGFAIGGGAFIRWLMHRIKTVSRSLEDIATGEADLSKRCKLYLRDEIGFLVIHFDAFCDRLQGIIKEVKGTKEELNTTGESLLVQTHETASAITQITASMDNVKRQIHNTTDSVEITAGMVGDISQSIATLDTMIDNQSLEVNSAASAIDEMIGSIGQVNKSVEKMAGAFALLNDEAQLGYNKQLDVNERIKQIEAQSTMLQEANTAISSIAAQTSLLAMNAAIEAAHAGEAGKGFSVVADEIRKLSETSSEQSKAIGEQLSSIMGAITEVVSASEDTSAAFDTVSTKIHETDELVVQIKAAMEEQATGSKKIEEALKIMTDSTGEVTNASKTIAQKNGAISDEIAKLQNVTQQIKQSMGEISTSSTKINQTGESLRQISITVQDSIKKIGQQIDLFKV